MRYTVAGNLTYIIIRMSWPRSKSRLPADLEAISILFLVSIINTRSGGDSGDAFAAHPKTNVLGGHDDSRDEQKPRTRALAPSEMTGGRDAGARAADKKISVTMVR